MVIYCYLEDVLTAIVSHKLNNKVGCLLAAATPLSLVLNARLLNKVKCSGIITLS
jgi:hypothetical protein